MSRSPRRVTARIAARYTVEHEPGDIIALPGCTAAILSRFGRYVHVLGGGEVRTLALAGEAALRRRSASLSLEDHQFHHGALFAWRQGFGAVYADVVHLWAEPWAAPATIRLSAPLASRDIAPAAAASLAHGDDIVVLLDDHFYKYVGRYLTRLRLTGGQGGWIETPRDVQYSAFSAIASPPYDYDLQSDLVFPVLIDVRAESSIGVFVHSVGRQKNYARYGMDYSALAHVEATGATTVVASLDPGFVTFSSDGRWVLLSYLRGKRRIGFLDSDGVLHGTLALSPDKVLGHVRHSFLRMDLYNEDLWFTDASGAVTCCTLTGLSHVDVTAASALAARSAAKGVRA